MPGMTIRGFLHQLPELLRLQLPPKLQDFQTVGPWGGLVKVHYGHPSDHYEVWVQRRMGQVELGLHFEGEAGANARHLEQLTQRAQEIRKALGSEVQPEEWTRHWTRLHETLELQDLDEDFLMEVSSRLACYIQVLQPMLASDTD